MAYEKNIYFFGRITNSCEGSFVCFNQFQILRTKMQVYRKRLIKQIYHSTSDSIVYLLSALNQVHKLTMNESWLNIVF